MDMRASTVPMTVSKAACDGTASAEASRRVENRHNEEEVAVAVAAVVVVVVEVLPLLVVVRARNIKHDRWRQDADAECGIRQMEEAAEVEQPNDIHPHRMIGGRRRRRMSCGAHSSC